MVSDVDKFVYLGCGKCGSSSIGAMLREVPGVRGHQHDSILYYRDRQSDWNDHYVFTFCRNPYSRLVSAWFEYKKKGMFQGLKNELSEKHLNRVIDHFPAFVKSIERVDHIHWNRFDMLLRDVDIDFVGRFENLQEDFDTVCDKIGIPRQQLPHENKSKHKHYTEYYDEATKQIVAEKYAKDIEYFNYKFDDFSQLD